MVRPFRDGCSQVPPAIPTTPRVAARRRVGSRRQGEVSGCIVLALLFLCVSSMVAGERRGMPRVGFGGSSCKAGVLPHSVDCAAICSAVVVLLFFFVPTIFLFWLMDGY